MLTISGFEAIEKGRWRHMAAVMSQRLQKIIQKGRVDQGDIPKGVWYAANDYFKPSNVLSLAEFLSDSSLGQYVGILVSTPSKTHKVFTRKKERTKLTAQRQRFAEFIDGLQQPHPLGGQELELAQKTRRLFIKLYQAGEDEAYEQSIALEFTV
jgi:hypothetical protein